MVNDNLTLKIKQGPKDEQIMFVDLDIGNLSSEEIKIESLRMKITALYPMIFYKPLIFNG